MKINLSSPDICQADIDAVVEVLKTPTLSLGPKLPEFEQAFAITSAENTPSPSTAAPVPFSLL